MYILSYAPPSFPSLHSSTPPLLSIPSHLTPPLLVLSPCLYPPLCLRLSLRLYIYLNTLLLYYFTIYLDTTNLLHIESQ